MTQHLDQHVQLTEKITSITVKTEDGQTHVFDGKGRLELINTYIHNPEIPLGQPGNKVPVKFVQMHMEVKK